MGQAIFYRQYLRLQPKFGFIYIFFTLFATIIGTEVLVRNDNPLLTRILGVILFITFLINFSKDYIYPYCNKKKNQTETLFDEKHSIEMIIANSNHDTDDHDINDHNSNDDENEMITSPSSYTSAHYTSESIAQEEDDPDDIILISGIPSDVKKYELDSFSKYLALIIGVLSSGFLRGLFGAGGPPMIIYFLTTNIDKRIVRSLSPFAVGYGSGIPLIINLLIIKKEFDTNEWITYLALFISMLLGLLLGNFIHRFVDQKSFRAALLFILFCGSINLMVVELGNISIYTSAVLMIIFTILLILMIIRTTLNSIKDTHTKFTNTQSEQSLQQQTTHQN